MTTPTKEELIKAAWDRWFEADYSWEGLKEKGLQDYWLTDPETGKKRTEAALIKAGELIRAEGQKTYHIAHLPLHYKDGTPTIKTSRIDEVQTRLNNVIQSRLKKSEFLWNNLSENNDKTRFKDTVARFDGAVLLKAEFHDKFINADFFKSIFVGSTDFKKARFFGNADFSDTLFDEKADFFDANFDGEAIFADASFVGGANFGFVEFGGKSIFFRTTFAQEVSYAHANFGKMALFIKSNWPHTLNNHLDAFFNAIFEDFADFRGNGFKAFSAFNGAQIKQNLAFDSPEKESDAGYQFMSELNEAKQSGKYKDANIEALQGGCRTLKQEMEKISDKTREHIFYKFEVMARRELASTPWSEKIASRIYGSISDYGMSLGMPIAWLLVLWVVFAIQYASYYNIMPLDLTKSPELTAHNLSEIAKALMVSGSRLFPFGAFEFVSRDFANQLSATHSDMVVLGYRVLASFESLLAIILAFLFGLAIRRRFQLS